MSAYLGIDLGPTAKMKFTDFELSRFSNNIKLRPHCRERDGRFLCYLYYRGHTINLGAYGTAQECNEVYDRALGRRLIRDRKPAGKGYSRDVNGWYKVHLGIGGGKTKYFGAHKTEEEAREVYLAAFNEFKEAQLKKFA